MVQLRCFKQLSAEVGQGLSFHGSHPWDSSTPARFWSWSISRPKGWRSRTQIHRRYCRHVSPTFSGIGGHAEHTWPGRNEREEEIWFERPEWCLELSSTIVPGFVWKSVAVSLQPVAPLRCLGLIRGASHPSTSGAQHKPCAGRHWFQRLHLFCQKLMRRNVATWEDTELLEEIPETEVLMEFWQLIRW